MKVIAGLGNPGHTYHHTRHNVGFRVIQTLAQRHDVRIDQRTLNPIDQRPAGVHGDYHEGSDTVRLLMPLTMMNESGDAFTAEAVSSRELLIVCDDVNLPLGTLRLRPDGSAGGHHGLHSCLRALGTEQVARLRIGVGVKELPRDLERFVLSPFQPAERPLIERTIVQAAEACEVWVREGLEVTMNRYNRAQES